MSEKSEKNFLDSIEIKTPCDRKWSEMRGGDQIRFCDHCAKDVHNLSNFTRKEARRLVAASNGKICVQYVRRSDGTIDTLKKRLHQITRQTGIAAGVLGTTLTVSAVAYAQTPTDGNGTENTAVAQIQKSDQPTNAVSGTITDPNGAVVSFAVVTLLTEQKGFAQLANANQEGFYEFKDVPDGSYRLKIEAAGFEPREIGQFSVGAGGSETQNAQLSVQTVNAEVVIGDDKAAANNVEEMGGSMIMVSNLTRNALVVAVENDDIEDVKARIFMGARVNGKDKSYDGNTALHVAVENGNVEIARVLLNAGAKVNSKNRERRTPLMMLDEDATPELINLLLSHGAKINAFDKGGSTALIVAAASADKDVVQTLIGAGATLDAANKAGETALMNAAENGETETVQLLLGAGANANLRNRDGKTALALVKNAEAEQYLTAYGATR